MKTKSDRSLPNTVPHAGRASSTKRRRSGERAGGNRRFDQKHHHRPAIRFGMYNPWLDFIISHSQRSLPRMLGGHKTPHVFWRVLVAMLHLTEEGRPCWAGIRYLAKEARCARETFIKYRDLAISLGFFAVEHRPGIGLAHGTSLYVPQLSSFWAVFRRRTESGFRTHVSELYTDTVKSTEPVSKPDPVACDGAAQKLELEPHRPIDQTPTPETTESHELESWELAKFLAMVAAVFGWNLKPREGRSLVYTARRRGLTRRWKPEAILHAIRNDATFRDGFEVFRSDQVRSPGAFLHARIQDLPEEQFAAVALCIPTTTAPIESPAAARIAPVGKIRPGEYACSLCSDTGRISFIKNGYDVAKDCECRKRKLAKVPPPTPKPREMKRLEPVGGVLAQLTQQLAQIPDEGQENAYLAGNSYSAGFTSREFGAEFIPLPERTGEFTCASDQQVKRSDETPASGAAVSSAAGETLEPPVTHCSETTYGVSHAPAPMGEAIAGEPVGFHLLPVATGEAGDAACSVLPTRTGETPDGAHAAAPRQPFMGETPAPMGETSTPLHLLPERTGEILERTRPSPRDGTTFANWRNFEKNPDPIPAGEPDLPHAAELTGQTPVHGVAPEPHAETEVTGRPRRSCRRSSRPYSQAPDAPRSDDG